MNAFPPRFSTGEQYWQFTVDFHNKVNERVNRLQVSNLEAEKALNDMLKPFALDLDHLEDAFLTYFWSVLFFTTFTFSISPETPSDDEKKNYTTFITDFCYIVPFSFKETPESRLVRDIMLDYISKMNFDTRDKAFESIVGLHNSICMHFGQFPKTVAEMKEEFGKIFDAKSSIEIARSSQMRDEDHKKMMELQQESIQLKKQISDGTAASCDCSAFQDATIALSVLLGVVITLTLIAFIMYRFKIGGNWNLSRSSVTKDMDWASKKFEKLKKAPQ